MARQPFIVIPHEPVSIGSLLEAPGRPASHLLEYLYPGMVWRSGATFAFNSFNMDLGSPKPIDFMALLGLEANVAATGQMLIAASAIEDNPSVYGGPIKPMPDIYPSPVSPSFQFQWFQELPSPIVGQFPRFWWANQDGFQGGATFLIVGNKITFQRYAEHDWEIGVDDNSTVAFTRSGVPDIAQGVIQRTLSFTMKWVSEAEYYEKIAPLDEAVGRQKPVLICFDPDAGSRRQALTFFGLLTENPRSRRINARAFERRFEIRSFI